MMVLFQGICVGTLLRLLPLPSSQVNYAYRSKTVIT